MKRLSLLVFILAFCHSLFSQEIKDKTKYYVKNIENFNNYSSNGWDLLDNKQLKVVAKALNINTEEAQKIITSTRYYNHPKNKKNTDVAYIMYKVCELNGFSNGGFKYTRPDDILCLMYVPNDLNSHLPSDKLAENGKGFYQVTRIESVSTTPLSSDYYKPMINLKDENYSFGFRYGTKNADSLVVQKIVKSSPAEKAGLKEDDVIIEFNGQNIRYKSRPEAAKIFKESAFTNNTFKFLRNNSIQTISIDKVNARTLEFVCISSNCDNGECIIENINGYTIKGNCKDGNIIGNAQFIADDNVVFYEGQVKKLSSTFNNYQYVKHGFGKEKLSKGNSFEGNYMNGRKEGNGVLTYADGTQKKGIWKEDKYYDDISIGFENDRFRVEKNKVFLHHLKSDFKSKMVEISDEEKQRIAKMYNISNADLDKLFALCDMKYKPSHLNTPQKIRAIIDKYEKDKPYDTYFVTHFYGLDNEIYNIIYLPTSYNRWLPQGVTFEVQDGLYFCVPATLTSSVNYFEFERGLAILKGAEEDKKRQQEQAELSAKHYEWAAKNKFKGVVIIQYENVMVENMYDRYKYNIITIFAPPSRTVEKSDYFALLDKYENYYKASGYKYVAINFEAGMDEVKATEKANELTQTHKFSVNTNFSYTLPEYKNQSDNNNSASLKKSEEELKEIEKERDKISKEIIEDKTMEKSTMRQKAMTDIFAGKNAINNPATVEVVDISTSDKYYTENKKFIGKTGTVEATLIENGDGTYYGTIQFQKEKYSTIFYKVKVKEVTTETNNEDDDFDEDWDALAKIAAKIPKSSNNSTLPKNISTGNYQTELKNLNKFIKTYEGSDITSIDINDGYITVVHKSGNIKKANMSDIGEVSTKEESYFTGAFLKCKNSEGCVSQTMSQRIATSFVFQTKNKKDLPKLVELLNALIDAYNK
jgi:hypothetical protein